MMRRREFLNLAAVAGTACATRAVSSSEPKPGMIDTNVSLFRWPFRRLPLDDTDSLVKKLRSLGITQAWAGSFEGVLHRDVATVNDRLADECERYPELIPIGAANPELPAWESDLRRCIEWHGMPAVRLHPNYHGYTLEDPRFARLLKQATAAGAFVQIVTAMEDTRTQHPGLQTKDVDLSPLPEVMSKVPAARVQILNYRPRPLIDKLAKVPGIYFDTARVEATDGVPTLVSHVPRGRVTFGSHAPFLVPEAALIRVDESSRLDEPALQRVYGGNASRLLDSNAKVDGRNVAIDLPLNKYRIWDSYFTPSHSHPGRDGGGRLMADIERSLPAIKKGGFEKLCYFAHVGIGTTTDAELETALRTNPDIVMKPLERWPKMLIGMIQLNANDVQASLDALHRWLRDGPMLGVYFPGGGPAALTCTHRNFNRLIERIKDLNGVIMQHTWFKTGGKQGPGESTPAELAELAARHPEQKFLCAHAGGEWQRGIRAVRDVQNVLVETSGFDATAGFIEMAVRELGAERIVFGSHLPSRSLGTELGKVIGANVSEHHKRLILGENYRKLLRMNGP